MKNRTLFFIVSCLLTLALASGILRTSFDTSLGGLLSQSDPFLEEFAELDEEFPRQVEVSYVFIPPVGETVFQQSVLAALADLRDAYKALPLASRLSSLIDYYSPEQQERLFVRPYDDYSQTELTALQNTALNDRLLTNGLLSDNASLTFGIVTLDAREASSDERLDIAAAALILRDELRALNPNVTIQVNSDVLLEQSSQQAMIDDLTTLLPFVILACVLVICYCFRSLTLGICILSHTIFTLLCTVGTLGYLGYSLNTISIIAPLVVVIISVANSVHIISIYKQSLHKGHEKFLAMQESISYNFQPVSLAALTTAIGFSSLNMCSSPAIQDFGQIVAIGIGFAYILTLTMLPALLIRFSKAAGHADPADSPFLHGMLIKLGDFTQRKDKAIFWSCSALALITLMLLPLNETDFDRLDFIQADNDLRYYYDEVSERMNRGPALVYGIDTQIVDGAIEPDFLQRAEAFSDWLRQQQDIESVASVIDLIKTVNQYSHQEDSDFYVLPTDIDTVASYLNGYEVVQSEDFPLSRFINNDFSLVPLFVNATPMSNQSLIDLDQRITEKFNTDFPEMRLLHGSGILLFARMDELVTIELLQGYSISLILITLCLVVGLRSLYFGVLSIIPNLLPATIVFGLWALFVGQLDPFVMMLFSISIGLVVDDTVHILSHYLDDRRRGSNQTNSIKHAINTAGPALTITTLVLALGTTILIGASTIYFQQAAKLLVPIVVLALVLDLLYLPTILKRFDKKALT